MWAIDVGGETISARPGTGAEAVLFRKVGQPWPRVAYSGKHVFVSGLLCPRCGAALHALVPRSAENIVNKHNLEELLRAGTSCRHD
jgi:hypothetical protein